MTALSAPISLRPPYVIGPCSFVEIAFNGRAYFLASDVEESLGQGVLRQSEMDELMREGSFLLTGAPLAELKRLLPDRIGVRATRVRLINEPVVNHAVMIGTTTQAEVARKATYETLKKAGVDIVSGFAGLAGATVQRIRLPEGLVRQSDPSSDVVRTFAFEDTNVAFIEAHGRPATTLAQAAQALQYDDPEHLRRLLASRGEDLEEGVDYELVAGDALAAMRALAPGLVPAHAPQLYLIYESGLHLLAMFSRQPRARAFRRWLVDELFPTLRRTGSYGLQRGAAAGLAPVQQRLDDMANQLRELQGTLDALLPIGDRFSVADALALIFERWYIWKANVPVTPAELCEWAFPQGDVRNAFERVLQRPPQAVSPLNPSTMKKWLTNAVGMEVQVRLAPRVTRIELRMSHGLNFWLRGL